MTFLIFMFAVLTSSESKGTGQTLQKLQVIGDVTQEVIIGSIPRPAKNKIFSPNKKTDTNWILTDTCSFYGRIKNKGEYVALIDNNGILPILSDTLTTIARQAVEASPEWIRIPLWDNFSIMGTTGQNIFGALILSAPSLYRDELAFVIARTDPVMLERHNNNPQIFLDNVSLIYKYDSVLDYVRIVEYPDYTTVKYKISDHNQDTTEIELPMEKYYWYIVHPVFSMEAIRYINPTIADMKYSGIGEAAPPVGKFWRDYYFNYPDTAEKTVWDCYGLGDTIYAGTVSPILKNELLGEQILYNNKTDTSDNNGAIGRVTKWVNDVMVFNAEYGDMWNCERSWQPVRQYHLHRGRCGEWADITAAAAKAALIPTSCPYDVCRDHTWNEWFDTDWHGWEPMGTHMNSPSRYENDGWQFNDIFAWRGDGYTPDVTPRYTPYCTLTVIVKDVDSLPVDGAQVRLGCIYYDDPQDSFPTFGNKRYTDSDGRVQFLLGDTRNYYINLRTGTRGFYPAGDQLYKIVTGSVAGQHYTWSHNLAGRQPVVSASEDTLSDSTEFYKIEVDFDVPQEIIHGQCLFPSSELSIIKRYGEYIDVAKNIEFFICDSFNFSLYKGGAAFKAFKIGHNAESGSFTFTCPKGKWYVVFSGKDIVENEEVVNLNVKLSVNTTGIDGSSKNKFCFSALPSPFRTSSSIDFMLPSAEKVNLALYDLSGRCVKKLITNEIRTGRQKIQLTGQNIKNGIYFIRFSTDTRTITKKIVKL
ncbi:MAG: T9SS type A sorting domain-containing protein [bacterium]|nr:T9SS type A sorting domain-containing protein [bacterium]